MVYENNGLFTVRVDVCEIQDGDRVIEYCGPAGGNPVIERDFDTLELAQNWLINNGYELE